MRLHTRARLQLIAAAVLFSTGGAAIKASTFTSWQVAGLRSGIAALTLLALVPAARKGWNWPIALVATAFGTTLILYVLANKLTTSANTIFLQSTAPLYILLLAPLILKEHVRREELGFMAVVGIGLVCFFVGHEAPSGTAPNPVLGNLLATGSGVSWALTVMGLRWAGGRGAGGGAAAAVACGNLFAFLATLPMALPLGHAGPGDWAIIGYLGIFQIGVAYMFVTSAIRHLTALEASVILLVEPALNPVWAWLVQGEVPGPWALTGGALILGATVAKSLVAGKRGEGRG